MMTKLHPVVKSLIIVFTGVPVALFAYLGQFSRMMSDDYCTIAVGQAIGAWDGMLYWFNNWAGSYANFFFKSAIAPLDTIVPSITPLITIVLWFVGLFWLTRQILIHLQIVQHCLFLSTVIANVVIFTTLNALYSPQSYYWYAASTHYTLPLAVLTIYFALSMTIVDSLTLNFRSVLGLIAGGIICFISAGASEIFVAWQSAFLTLLVGLIIVFVEQAYRKQYLVVLGVGWIATIIGLIIQLMSPGVSNRLVVESENIVRPLNSMSEIITETLNLSFQYLGHIEAFTGFVILLFTGLLITLVFCTPAQDPQPNKTFVVPVRYSVFAIGIQLIFIPILWGHSSDNSQILGRFSYGFFVVVLIHGLLLALYLIGLLKKDWITSQLHKREIGSHTIYVIIGCVFLLLFALTQLRNIHYKASIFLITNAILWLGLIATQLTNNLSNKQIDKLEYRVIACHVVVIILVGAVTFTALFGRGLVTQRILSPVAHLLVLLGLLWGVYLGFLLKRSSIEKLTTPRFRNVVVVAMLAMIIMTSVGIFIGQAALMPDLQTYSTEWDAQHLQIIAMRDSGQSNIEINALSFDLADMIKITNLSQDPANRCAVQYYGVGSINVLSQ